MKKNINSSEIEKDKNKVLKFPAKDEKTLTDNEIQSLFLGLVKLIKENANENANKIVKSEFEVVNKKIRENIVEVSKKEQEIFLLDKQNKQLKDEIKKLKNKIQELRSVSLENLQQ